jgi:hypothetical protein
MDKVQKHNSFKIGVKLALNLQEGKVSALKMSTNGSTFFDFLSAPRLLHYLPFVFN